MTPTYHPRSEWQDPSNPITGPAADWSKIDTAVIHYTAAAKIPADIPAYLRAMQRDYTSNRGYSVGYMYAVDQSGDVWQLRGPEFRSAANKGHNDHTLPILMLVDGNGGASYEAVDAVRWIIAEGAKRAGRDLAIVTHGDIGATACPGVGLTAQVRAGVFTPQPDPPPPNPVPPTEEDEDMAKIAYYLLPPVGYPAGSPEFVVVDGSIRYRTNADRPGLLPDERVPAEQYDNLRKSAGM